MKQQTTHNLKKTAAWVACAAAAIGITCTGVWAYVSPYSYVSLDVNPSIEYSLNRFDRVLSATAVNEDGAEILSDLDLRNKTIEDAVSSTIVKIDELGYFDGDTAGGVVIATSGENEKKSQALSETLLQSTQEAVDAQQEDAEIVVDAISVGLDRVQEAKELGVTPGKLNLVEKLRDCSADPDSVNMQEWLGKSVRDIMQATKQNRTQEKVAVKEGQAEGKLSQNEAKIKEKVQKDAADTSNGAVNGSGDAAKGSGKAADDAVSGSNGSANGSGDAAKGSGKAADDAVTGSNGSANGSGSTAKGAGNTADDKGNGSGGAAKGSDNATDDKSTLSGGVASAGDDSGKSQSADSAQSEANGAGQSGSDNAQKASANNTSKRSGRG
ncbi:MAG: hypothetical protein ACERKO_04075 [Acetanaerobacterium sp.]